MKTMSLEEIITRAIPLDDCPQKKSRALHRRVDLEKRIKAYVAEQIKENEQSNNHNSGSGVDEYLRDVLPVQDGNKGE